MNRNQMKVTKYNSSLQSILFFEQGMLQYKATKESLKTCIEFDWG